MRNSDNISNAVLGTVQQLIHKLTIVFAQHVLIKFDWTVTYVKYNMHYNLIHLPDLKNSNLKNL